MNKKVARLFVSPDNLTTGFVLYSNNSMSTPLGSKLDVSTEIELSLHFGAITEDEARRLRKEVTECLLPDE